MLIKCNKRKNNATINDKHRDNVGKAYITIMYMQYFTSFEIFSGDRISGYVSKISGLKFQLKSNESSPGTNVQGRIMYLYPSQAEL